MAYRTRNMKRYTRQQRRTDELQKQSRQVWLLLLSSPLVLHCVFHSLTIRSKKKRKRQGKTKRAAGVHFTRQWHVFFYKSKLRFLLCGGRSSFVDARHFFAFHNNKQQRQTTTTTTTTTTAAAAAAARGDALLTIYHYSYNAPEEPPRQHTRGKD
jgi:hypothetical protein